MSRKNSVINLKSCNYVPIRQAIRFRFHSFRFLSASLVLSNYTLDTMRVKSYLRMIDDEDYLLSYSDVEIACHEYVNRYIEKKE